MLALSCALLWPCFSFAAQPRPVVLLLSDSSAPYQEAARAVQSGLEAEAGTRITLRVAVLDEPGVDGALAQPDALIVAVGHKAVQVAMRSDAPVLAVLIARVSYEQLYGAGGAAARRRPMSAIYLDQPASRHFQLLRAALPQARSVGVLFGAGSVSSPAELSAAASASGFELRTASLGASADLFPSLQELLPEVDALLLLPDPRVVNRASLQNLMLATYRQRVPVLGYSQSLVEAGSLLAVYSSPQQIGRQAAETILRMLSGRGWELPPPAYPKYFTVRTNSYVGRALDIALPAESALLQRLGAGGGS